MIKIKLTDTNIVFLNNNEIINLAGIIGGKSTSCSKNTRSVIIECAYFCPEEIIGKSVKYDIHSEASYKFERGVDPRCHDKVLRRFLKIIDDHAKIKNVSLFSKNYIDPVDISIPLQIETINKKLGVKISKISLKIIYQG